MELYLKRRYCGATYTIGSLYVDNRYFCDTLEDTVRALPAVCPDTPKGRDCRCPEKIYAQTAIPAGTYKITLERSPRFKRVLPRLHGVPHFRGVLMHSGNAEEDSAGCILVGKNDVKGKVVESRATMDALMKRLSGQKSIRIEII